MEKEIIFFGAPCICACDGKCNKAWGINNRPSRKLSDNDEDYEFLSDSELGIAPEDPGTYEGGEGKSPLSMNKWCVRECERSKIIEKGKPIILSDFSKPVKNIP